MAGRDLTVPRIVCHERIVWMDGEDGRKLVDKIDRDNGVVARGATDKSIAKAVEHLKQWDYGEPAEVITKPELLPGEKRAYEDEYVLTWHLGLGHVSLDRITMRRGESPCGCFPHVTYMTGFGFHCETEDQGYCNFECPHEEDESA